MSTVKPKKQKAESKKTQVITFRLPHEIYLRYEQKCIEQRIPMSQISRQAVLAFMN
jgi:hypothetical protein